MFPMSNPFTQASASTSSPLYKRQMPAFGHMERKLSLLLSSCDGTHDFVRDGPEEFYADQLHGKSEDRIMSRKDKQLNDDIVIAQSLSSSPILTPSSSNSSPSTSPVPRPTLGASSQTAPNLPTTSSIPQSEVPLPRGQTVKMLPRRVTTGHFDPSKDARLLAI
jgi:hypothetical protein